MKKVSLVITVLNEVNFIAHLLESIELQTKLPDELVIVDGSSNDGTLDLIRTFATKSKLNIKIFERKGNISVGRNYGISKAQFSLIASTDAGCRLDPDWLKYLIAAHQKSHAQVIAGYALGDPSTRFEEAVVPYVLVMPDRVRPNTYLPATRSMLFEKKVWQQLGGFDESLAVSEDFAFAHKLVSSGVQIYFEKKAIVYWKPRSDYSSFLKMIFNFAQYDVRAGIYRPKVYLIFVRYFISIVVILIILMKSTLLTFYFILLAFLLYSFWSITKNKRYVPNGWFYLPSLQLGSDFAVMLGSLYGFLNR